MKKRKPEIEEGEDERMAAFRTIMRLSGALRRRMHRMFDGSGITARGFRVLRRIPEAGSTLKALAEATGMESANLSVMVERLVREGLVVRAPSEVDRREVWISRTEAGWERWEALEGPFREEVGEMMSGLAERELRTMVVLLAKVAERVGEERKE